MKTGIRVNGHYFPNTRDAARYVLQLTCRGEKITILQNEKPNWDDLVRS